MESEDWENPDVDHEAEFPDPYEQAELVTECREKFIDMIAGRVKQADIVVKDAELCAEDICVDNEGFEDGEDCAYDVINAMYRYDRNGGTEDGCDDYHPAVNGIVNMTDDVMTRRKNRGLKRYYEMPVIAKGEITGGGNQVSEQHKETKQNNVYWN